MNHTLRDLVIDTDGVFGFTSKSNRQKHVLCMLAFCIFAFFQKSSFAACPIPTANLKAGKDVCSIIIWLHSLPKRHINNILSGQYGWKDTAAIHRTIGKWPALYEDHLWQLNTSSWDDWKVAETKRKLLKQYWDNGGLVSIHMPIPNPKNKSDQLDRDLTDREFKDVTIDGTEMNRSYLEWMGNLASHLRWLQKEGVTVFIRPLHEMNGAWFWYGKRNQDDFKKLFRLTVEFLTRDQDLDNLIIIYSPNRGQGVADYYPGDNYVDIVGIDSYQDQPASISEEYEYLRSTKKPFAITELGWSAKGAAQRHSRNSKEQIIDAIKVHAPTTLWWSSWADTNSPANQNECKQLYDDPSVMTRDEVDWRNSAASR